TVPACRNFHPGPVPGTLTAPTVTGADRMSRLFSLAALLLALLAVPTRGADDRGYLDPDLTPADREHWAFKPPARPALPAVKNAALVSTPIDRFILAKLEAAGLKPAPEAYKLTLIRRVTLDLTGLPP